MEDISSCAADGNLDVNVNVDDDDDDDGNGNGNNNNYPDDKALCGPQRSAVAPSSVSPS